MPDLDSKIKQPRPFLLPPEVQLQSEKEDKNKRKLFQSRTQRYCNYAPLQRRYFTAVDVTVPESVGRRQAHYARGHWTTEDYFMRSIHVPAVTCTVRGQELKAKCGVMLLFQPLKLQPRTRKVC